MSSYSRIAQEHSSNLSSLATHRGIEHGMAVEEGSGYVTFEFTTPRSKRAFDLLCAENGVDVDRGRIVNLMLDAIVEGASPSEVLEKYSAKKLQVTQGMANAFRKRPKYSCSSCGLAIPKYTGGYPRSCPNCNGDLSDS